MNRLIYFLPIRSLFGFIALLVLHGLAFADSKDSDHSYTDVLEVVLLDADDTIWRDYQPGKDAPVSTDFSPNHSQGFYTTDFIKASNGERIRKTHVLEPNAVKFIVHLISKGVKVYLFSNSQMERNISLLQQIPIGELSSSDQAALKKAGVEKFDSLLDLIPPSRILDSKSLVEVGKVADSEIPFFAAGESRNALKKNAKKWLDPTRFDLNKTILVDDSRKYQSRGQETNLLWLGDREIGLPPDSSGGFFQNHRLAFAAGLIDRVVSSARASKITVTSALWQMQWSALNLQDLSLKIDMPPFAHDRSLLGASYVGGGSCAQVVGGF